MTDITPQRPDTPQFTRVTSLFQRGDTVPFEDAEGSFCLYVAALTSVEREEAVLDASVARARETLATGPESEAGRLLRNELEQADRLQIIERLLVSRAAEAWNLGQDDLHADEYWRGDRLLLIERADAVLNGGGELSADQRADLIALNEEYMTAWKQKAEARAQVWKSEYEIAAIEDLIEEYLKTWVETKTMQAQIEAYSTSLLYFGVRTCQGVEDARGGFDHSACDGHRTRLFPDREAARQMPDELRERLLPVANHLDQAGQAALGKSTAGSPGSD